MTIPEEKKDYGHLEDEQIIKLLGKCRLMNFENFPEEFNGIVVPHGNDLMEEVIRRLRLGQYAWDRLGSFGCLPNADDEQLKGLIK